MWDLIVSVPDHCLSFYFEESKDKMDSYLSRFEKYATANKWDKNMWATYLSALLKGRALNIYDRP